MDFFAEIDAYCERSDPSYWSEPLNAFSNAAFLIAAWVMWRRLGDRGPAPGRALVGLLAAIGLGSFLFHTYARAWAAIADVVPIGLFILTYLYAANRHYLALPPWAAGLAAAGFLPYAALLGAVFAALPFFAISAPYWPVAVLILLYALALRGRSPVTASGLAFGAGLLAVSLLWRSLDLPLCRYWPLGTHFLWHLHNALMLGWMIEVLRRHKLAEPGAGG